MSECPRSNARVACLPLLSSLSRFCVRVASRRQDWTLSSCETQSGVVRRHANRSIDGPTDGYCRRRRRRRVNRIPFHDIPFRARSPDLPRVGSGRVVSSVVVSSVVPRPGRRRRLFVVLFYMDKQCVFTDFLSKHSSKSNQPIPQPAPIDFGVWMCRHVHECVWARTRARTHVTHRRKWIERRRLGR